MSLRSFLLVGSLVFSMTAPALAGEIRLALLPRLPEEELRAMFTPLAEYLGKETGETVTLVIPEDYPSFMERARKGEFDLGMTNPLVYLYLHQETGVLPLVMEAEEDKTCMFRGVLLVREGAGIEMVPEMKGRRIVYVDKCSCGGYLSQALFLHRQGIEMDRDLEVLAPCGRYDCVVQALVEGKADIGCIREDDVPRARSLPGFSKIKVLVATDYLPSWCLWTEPSLGASRGGDILEALTKIPRKDPVLKAALCSGFLPASDVDFENLRQSAAKAKAFAVSGATR